MGTLESLNITLLNKYTTILGAEDISNAKSLKTLFFGRPNTNSSHYTGNMTDNNTFFPAFNKLPNLVILNNENVTQIYLTVNADYYYFNNCHSTCKRCTGPDTNQCISCFGSLYYFKN